MADVLPRFNVYKPNREGKGAAVQFDLNAGKQAVFLEAAAQEGEGFNWRDKIVVKLSDVDLGKVLAVLNGRSGQAKIFHDPSKREGYVGGALNTTVELLKGSQYGFFLKVSQQSGDRSVKAVALGLAEDEAQVLRVLLEKAVERMYGW